MSNRDTDDHVAWLLQHGWHEKALEAVEAGRGRTELMEEVRFLCLGGRIALIKLQCSVVGNRQAYLHY
jgi:hypothetical protein